jgi:hypothetical protein
VAESNGAECPLSAFTRFEANDGKLRRHAPNPEVLLGLGISIVDDASCQMSKNNSLSFAARTAQPDSFSGVVVSLERASHPARTRQEQGRSPRA